jgi:hypothetical protein
MANIEVGRAWTEAAVVLSWRRPQGTEEGETISGLLRNAKPECRVRRHGNDTPCAVVKSGGRVATCCVYRVSYRKWAEHTG